MGAFIKVPYEPAYPPIRELFRPDIGYTLCSSDLDRADVQVVAWDSNCAGLKAILKEGLDLHLANAAGMFKLDITLDRLRDPAQVELLSARYKTQRQLAKNGCHLINYAGGDQTLAITLGISLRQAAEFREKYLILYPEIEDWHRRIFRQLVRDQRVHNAWGYHRIYFGRITDNLIKEAAAWIGQSTVAITINKCWEALENAVPEPDCEVLLQVHDELIYQVLTAKFKRLKPAIYKAFHSVVIPYEDPLTIPAGLKTSLQSWGNAKPESWS
jgi:DNA polymerase I-like protein with 3'-5' exonuclease and polymerase domains